MSSSAGAETRARIVSHALSRFNADGVESVGVREISRDLALSPGNVSYHFATKEDLLRALWEDLSAANTRAFDSLPAALHVDEFLAVYRRVFANQFEYRCLMLGVVHQLRAHPNLAERYARSQSARRDGLMAALRSMERAGCVRARQPVGRLNETVAMLSMVSRSWVADASLTFGRLERVEAIGHAERLLVAALRPVLSRGGLVRVETSSRCHDDAASSTP